MRSIKIIALVLTLNFVIFPIWSLGNAIGKYHIAITKITSHPSLNLIEKGILDVLKGVYPDIKITSNNAQGNITIAAQIAQKFASLDPTIVVPITTPSAQTITKAFRGKKTPIVFSAVTDPIGAHLLTSLEKSINNLTGVIDQPPVQKTVEVMRKINPKIKTIGVIYNAGEANSEYQIASLRIAAEKFNIAIREIPVAKVSDIQMAATSIITDVEAIFLPNDNLVISSLEGIIKIAHENAVPVYVSDPQSIDRGAFIAIAFDQYDIGRKTGKLLLNVLKSGSTKNNPPIILNNPKFYINETVAMNLGVSQQLIKELKKQYK